MERALYGEQRAKEEAAKRAAAEERAAKRAAERNKVEKAKEWSDEEVRLLEKALDKFPQVGTPLSLLNTPSQFSFSSSTGLLRQVPHGGASYTVLRRDD